MVSEKKVPIAKKNPTLEELKRSVDLVALVRGYGVDLKSYGKNWVGRCPFHEDKTPSFVVTPSKNLWHCMGACRMGGSAIDFVMKKEGISVKEAIMKLRKLQIAEPTSQTSINTIVPRKEEIPRKRYEEFTKEEQGLIESVFGYYQETFFKSKEAKEYLRSRGIYDKEILRKFRVGLGDGSLVERFLPSWHVQEGKDARRTLIEFGLAAEKVGSEHFKNYLVFPLLDENGNLAGAYGRHLEVKKPMGRFRHRYMKGPHAGLWNREAFGEKSLVLCESVIDALTFYVNGIRNVTCSFGVEGYTEELHEEILKQNPKRVSIAYDNDPAGNEASEKLAARLLKEGIPCYRVKFPMEMDVNEYALKVAKPGEMLNALVLDAVKIRVEESFVETEEDLSSLEEETELKEETPQGLENSKGFVVTRGYEEIVFRKGEREYRVRSLFKNQGMDIMKVNLRLLVGENYHIETLDLMNERARKGFIQGAGDATGILEETIRSDLKEVFRESEEMLWEHLEKIRKPAKEEIQLTPKEMEEATRYLKDSELVSRILEDFEKCGLVGERTNSLLGYLSTITRRTENPLAVIIQSSSSAGKSTLMDSILDFVPEEEKEKYSAMTGQSLFYMGAKDLKYKVLAISEEEGVEKAKYALKILQSEKKISIATTSKDQQTGKLSTTEYTVEGPVVLFLTTTSVEIDEELQNRAIVLTVNEDREQTKTILMNQRSEETLEGVLRKKTKDRIVTLHQNIQRLLKPLAVVNPYANELHFPDTRLRMRRDQKKYLTLIRSIALLHQFQREIKKAKDATGKEVPYIEVERSDISLAGILFNRIFGRNLDDLSPHTRKLLSEIGAYVKELCTEKKLDKSEVRLTRKEIRERTGVSDTRLRIHLKRLEELEYVYARPGKQGLVVEYELLWEEERGDDFTLTFLEEETCAKQVFDWNTVLLPNPRPSSTSPSKEPTSPGVRLPLAPPSPGGSLGGENANGPGISASIGDSLQIDQNASENASLGE
ncbi:toprim domain-containing protein [Leptospira fletcheri]|uniref:Toprim domain-containing protein n=1 Tax=Leptospira fletcheri TaxID=2484981 RepID=A0A4R9G485_9LEPT|nr:CHC2 zinc finger domain-containing protein [Leptospira fletcheri]TGK06318.1 toprim domain-containing protein [Leptospira fletcheri]